MLKYNIMNSSQSHVSEVAYSFETSVDFQHTTRRYVPDDRSLLFPPINIGGVI
jgi:hypothetical protein